MSEIIPFLNHFRRQTVPLLAHRLLTRNMKVLQLCDVPLTVLPPSGRSVVLHLSIYFYLICCTSLPRVELKEAASVEINQQPCGSKLLTPPKPDCCFENAGFRLHTVNVDATVPRLHRFTLARFHFGQDPK